MYVGPNPLEQLPFADDLPGPLRKADENVERPATDWRARVFALADALFASIKMQTSVPKYQAISVDRGATLDTIDVPLNNRLWLEERFAQNAGVNLDLVNVMAMDYQRSTGDYGNFAVQAAQSTFTQLKGLYPSKTDAQVWRMLGVTPMLGKNDDGGTYDQNDARQLVTFAQQNHLGMLSFWEMTRDRNACNGALYLCTNIPQSPYEFSKIFAGYTG